MASQLTSWRVGLSSSRLVPQRVPLLQQPPDTPWRAARVATEWGMYITLLRQCIWRCIPAPPLV